MQNAINTESKRYDAGEERERMAFELANWMAGAWKTGAAAERFYKRVRRHARIINSTFDAVMADLRSDAANLLDEEGIDAFVG